MRCLRKVVKITIYICNIHVYVILCIIVYYIILYVCVNGMCV